jgi:hypothetical protein
MHTWAGLALIAGALLFFAAAFSPISGRVFSPSASAQDQIEAVVNQPLAWTITSILFAPGAVVAVLGLFLYSCHLVAAGAPSSLSNIAMLAAVLAAVGAGMWTIVNYYRIVHTPEQVFLEGSLGGGWMFPTYTVLTQLALLLIGYTLLQAGYPGWLGWGMIVLVSLTIIAMVVFRDMPPFVHYIWILVMGIMVVVRGASTVTDPRPLLSNLFPG